MTLRRCRPLRTRALLLVLAMSATAACAGEVGKYRDTAILPNSAEAGATAAGADPSAAPASPEGSAALDTTVATTATAGPAASPGYPALTPTSGPGARLSGQGAQGPTARTAAGSNQSAPAGGDPSAEGSRTGTEPNSPAGGGTAGAPVAPAPVTPPGGGTTIGVSKDSVTIGFFLPKTGPYAGLFRNLPAVLEATFKEAGQIHGRRLILKTYDDGTANASTIQAEEKRARHEFFALLSGVGETNVVLAPLADQHKVPLVIANIDEQVALPLTYVFALTAYWRHQATVLPSFIKSQLGGAGKRIGVVYEGTSTAKNAKEAFRAKAARVRPRRRFRAADRPGPVGLRQRSGQSSVP